ncbi:MAG: hypothetical protein JWM99_4665 [Verrucomicrobiales bacterium]|nr:hypothetical protein [Verrucomicrobiales bacterium]
MASKPIFIVLVLVLLVLGGVIVWQQQTLSHLQSEMGTLREQVSRAESVRAEDQRLISQSKTDDDGAKGDRTELMRLRAQVARLKQLERENAQAKPVQPRRSASAIQEPPITEPVQQVVAAPGEGAGAPPASVNFGVVEFSEGIPTRLDLGSGRQCVVTTTTLPDGNLQLQFTAVSNAAEDTPTQVTQTVTVTPGAQLFSSMNGIQIALKPVVKAP